MAKTILGIDGGYFAFKGVSPTKSIVTPSIVGTPDGSQMFVHESDENVIEFNGLTFMIGQGAIEKSRMTQRPEDRQWITGNVWLALFYHTLSEIAQPGNVHVITGLPASFYNSDKETMLNVVNGKHEFVANGKKYEYDISATVVIQPLGSVCDMVLNLSGNFSDLTSAEGKFGAIDVGGKTTNILTVQRMADIQSQTFSVDKGGWDIVRSVKTGIQNRFADAQLEDHEVAEAIKSKSIKRFGSSVDISDIVDPVLQSVTKQIISITTQPWGNGSGLDKIVISGGAANLVGEFLLEHFNQNGVLLENPQFANAVGYYKYGKLLETYGRV